MILDTGTTHLRNNDPYRPIYTLTLVSEDGTEVYYWLEDADIFESDGETPKDDEKILRGCCDALDTSGASRAELSFRPTLFSFSRFLCDVAL